MSGVVCYAVTLAWLHRWLFMVTSQPPREDPRDGALRESVDYNQLITHECYASMRVRRSSTMMGLFLTG